MARRGRDEIGKALLAVKEGGAVMDSAVAAPVSPKLATPVTPPAPPSSTKPSVGGDVYACDEEDAATAFEAALLLCAKEASDAPVDALRALFAASVQRAAEARWRRDSMEDRCNEAAARNQAGAAELAARRAAASRAQATKATLEAKCRQQAQLNQLTAEHVKTAKAAEEARSADLREKFEKAVPTIQEKLKVEAERRQQQRLGNEELRQKLASFAEQARLSKEACTAQLTPASLRIEIAEAKCEQQEARRRAGDARTNSLQVELERAKASHAKLKADTIARERSLSKIQNILNERKAMSAGLEIKIKELAARKASLEADVAVLKEVAASEEASKSHTKMVERLRGLCGQLESDVEEKRRGLAALQLQKGAELR